MNTLTINEEVRNNLFEYETNSFKYNGRCSIDENNNTININVNIVTKDTNNNIGSCSTDNNFYMNVWNIEYQNLIDTIATDFKALQTELKNHYTVK